MGRTVKVGVLGREASASAEFHQGCLQPLRLRQVKEKKPEIGSSAAEMKASDLQPFAPAAESFITDARAFCSTA